MKGVRAQRGKTRGDRRRRALRRGFTLAELMAVVAIMGVLAALALTAFHRRAYQSDAAEAKVVMKSIAVAEEHYRAENQVYLNVSSSGDTGWYPQKTIPPNHKQSFWRSQPDGGGDTETTNWQTLAPEIHQRVGFAFKANAGLPTTAPTLDTTDIKLPPNSPVEPWFVVQARADADGDNTACFLAAASWTPEIAVVNEGE
jgi:prepilin-type N-terminal cleavage/methylation domain-containing protein